jgi:ABC-type nitrate/sulfonate/bicarbonate transport system ATPase subunit
MLLQEFGLLEQADKYPIQLSGGQRQRVAVAQQLICSKHYLVMDEPFSGLDVVSLARVRKMIIDVSNKFEENSFLVTTHDVTSAVSIADTIWLMGRDSDTAGNKIPGARIVDTIDLIERDIAWHAEPEMTPQGVQLIREIKARCSSL